jgi:hypothetical protein
MSIVWLFSIAGVGQRPAMHSRTLRAVSVWTAVCCESATGCDPKSGLPSCLREVWKPNGGKSYRALRDSVPFSDWG